jgi:hypothetical protein
MCFWNQACPAYFLRVFPQRPGLNWLPNWKPRLQLRILIVSIYLANYGMIMLLWNNEGFVILEVLM